MNPTFWIAKSMRHATATPRKMPLEESCSTIMGLHLTGTLLNNVAQDRTPYFLTANHCV